MSDLALALQMDHLRVSPSLGDFLLLNGEIFGEGGDLLLELQLGRLIIINQSSILNNHLDEFFFGISVNHFSLMQLCYFIFNQLTVDLELLLEGCPQLLHLQQYFVDLTDLYILEPVRSFVG